MLEKVIEKTTVNYEEDSNLKCMLKSMARGAAEAMLMLGLVCTVLGYAKWIYKGIKWIIDRKKEA